MDLARRTQTIAAPENHEWLGSAHGTDSTETITLDVSLFNGHAALQEAATKLPSGVALGKVTATGLFGPYNNALANGQEVLAGFLFTTQVLDAASGGFVTANTGDVGAAMLTHGKVRVAKLPTGHGLDAAGRVDVAGRILFLE